MKKYKSIGFVLGNCWGGGVLSYPAEKLQADTKKELVKEANKLLKSGGLDSGMGFESLKGAILEIEEIETIKKDGKEFERSEFEFMYSGTLSDEDKDFLMESFYN